MKKSEVAAKQIEYAQSAIALMKSSNDTLRACNQRLVAAAKALITSDVGKAFMELQDAIKQAEMETPF